jgi:hypothetical protein
VAAVESDDRASIDRRREKMTEEDRRLETLTHWLDSKFRVPGTRFRFGLDGILGLIPGVGDSVTAAISLLLLREGIKKGIPARTLARMGVNLGLDWAIGAIPLVGDVYDFFWKSNTRNLKLLRRHLEEHRRNQEGP